jgi:hypothetical protein
MINRNRWLRPLGFGVAATLLAAWFAAARSDAAPAMAQQRQDPLAEPFKGVTTNGTITPGLFPIRASGVSTAPMRTAAERFLGVLNEEQRARTTFPVDNIEWRDWNNVHRHARKGVNFQELTETQRERAFDLMRASLSAEGLRESRNIMRLNGYLAQVRNNFEEYGEYLYHLTVMGSPSELEPWGWQLDGHHLIINYFVLGDQVVMTPTFMGSEPVSVDTGTYAGTRVLEDEQNLGLAFMQSLSRDQQAKATLETSKTRNHALAQAFRDNLVLDYAGLRATELSAPQRERLLQLIAEYVGNMDDGHARVRMEEVAAHVADTYFAWIGETGADAVFYYRIQSPVILIEFDHQMPVALPGDRVPSRRHVHTVVRTPNGNDYGKDLLRQHYEKHRNDPAHGHRHDP